MSVQPATSIFVMVGGVYFSPLTTSLGQSIVPTTVDVTNMGSDGVTEMKMTTFGMNHTLNVFLDEEKLATDHALNRPTETNRIVTARKAPIAADDFWSSLAIPTQIPQVQGALGDVYQGELSFVNGSNLLTHGIGVAGVGGTLHFATTTATGSGTAVEFGALGVTEKLRGELHVITDEIAGTSPSLTVTIERDVVGFGSPTVVLSFAAVTDVTTNQQQLLETSVGAQSETFYRVAFTISGSAGQSFRWWAGISIA